MGITVISSPAPAAPAAVGSATTTAGAATADALPGGFAALLGSQLNLVIASSAQTTATASTRETEKPEEPRASGDSADQTLSMLMAVPPVTPPIQSNQPVHIATTIERDAGEKSGGDSRAIADLTSASPKAGATDAMRASTDAFNNALNSARDGKPEIATANIAAETGEEIATQASTTMASHPATTASKGQNATPSVEVRTPLQSPAWGQDFSNKVTWMVKNDQHSAQININPPQLGPVQITLQINGDQASAIFASPHNEVRQAIESSLSQLRDMLATAGINLGQTDIGANLARQNDNAPFQTANGNRATDETAILPDIGKAGQGAASAPIQRGRGLVDLFA